MVLLSMDQALHSVMAPWEVLRRRDCTVDRRHIPDNNYSRALGVVAAVDMSNRIGVDYSQDASIAGRGHITALVEVHRL
jgi:hypothetical protein